MRRLYKIKQQRKFLGVCAGLAEFFDCDPTIVRLITIGLAICTFSLVFWIYIIAALIMPEKVTIE